VHRVRCSVIRVKMIVVPDACFQTLLYEDVPLHYDWRFEKPPIPKTAADALNECRGLNNSRVHLILEKATLP
jgi:hypothetical protein